jgi:hypothetical protein
LGLIGAQLTQAKGGKLVRGEGGKWIIKRRDIFLKLIDLLDLRLLVKAALVVEDVLALPVALADGKDAFDHLEKPRSAGGVVCRCGTETTSNRRRDGSHN